MQHENFPSQGIAHTDRGRAEKQLPHVMEPLYAGTAHDSAEAPYLNDGMQQSIDMDVDVSNQGIAIPALPSQEMLAKLQAFCEDSLQPPWPPGPLQACSCQFLGVETQDEMF